jgi:hypothetical protein
MHLEFTYQIQKRRNKMAWQFARRVARRIVLHLQFMRHIWVCLSDEETSPRAARKTAPAAMSTPLETLRSLLPSLRPFDFNSWLQFISSDWALLTGVRVIFQNSREKKEKNLSHALPKKKYNSVPVKDAAPHVRLCGKFTTQPHVR